MLKRKVHLLRTGAVACGNSVVNQREMRRRRTSGRMRVEVSDDGPVVWLPFCSSFPLFLALPVCIDSNDKHSPGGPADSASSHLISSFLFKTKAYVTIRTWSGGLNKSRVLSGISTKNMRSSPVCELLTKDCLHAWMDTSWDDYMVTW